MDISNFLKWEALSYDCIDVKRIYIDIADDLVAGILLSQIVYYNLPSKNNNQKDNAEQNKLRIIKEGKKWLAKGRSDWWDECRISEKQFDRAIVKLVEKGLVEKKIFKFNGNPQVHIWLCLDKLITEIENIIDSEKNSGKDAQDTKDSGFLPLGKKEIIDNNQSNKNDLQNMSETKMPENTGSLPLGKKEITQEGIRKLTNGQEQNQQKVKNYNIDNNKEYSIDNNKAEAAEDQVSSPEYVVETAQQYGFQIHAAEWLIKELARFDENQISKILETMREKQDSGRVKNAVGALRKNTSEQIEDILHGRWYIDSPYSYATSQNSEYEIYVPPQWHL